MTHQEAFGIALALAAVLVTMGSFRAMVAINHGDAGYLFEPQWKREARELSRYIPVGDEWGR